MALRPTQAQEPNAARGRVPSELGAAQNKCKRLLMFWCLHVHRSDCPISVVHQSMADIDLGNLPTLEALGVEFAQERDLLPAAKRQRTQH